MKIMFVCTGNAARSAAAEAVMKRLIADSGLAGIEASSCGTNTAAWVRRDKAMCRIAAEYGYDMGGHAVAMTEEALNSADLVVVMARHHRDMVTRHLAYDRWPRIVRFAEYCFGEEADIPDPHCQADSAYRECFLRIEDGCKEILKKIQKQ